MKKINQTKIHNTSHQAVCRFAWFHKDSFIESKYIQGRKGWGKDRLVIDLSSK